VEHVNGLEFLAKIDGGTATAAIQGLSAALNRVSLEMRQTFTYGQDRELVHHSEITQKPVRRSTVLTHTAPGSEPLTRTPMLIAAVHAQGN
jgi:hypothetical protein